MTEELEKLRDYLRTKKPALSRLEGVVNDIIIKNRNDRELLVKLCIRTGILQSFIKESSRDPIFLNSCKKKLIEEFFFGESAVEKAIAYCKFLTGEETETELIPYRKSNKWGYCTSDKKIVIDCEFDMVFKFTEGFGRVRKNNLYGFIDMKGNFLTDIKYKVVSEFKEGFAGLTEDYDKYNFINKQGQIVFGLKGFEDIQNFHNGYAGVVKNDKLGFINLCGDLVIPPIYDQIWLGLPDRFYKEIYDGDGAFFYSNMSNFKEGCVRLEKNGKYGFTDTTGKIIAPFIFDEADDFSEGLAEVGIITPTNGADIRSGYIDKSGTYVIPLKYQYENKKIWGYSRQSQFSEGKALVTSMSKSGYGFGRKEFFINKNDESIIESDSYEFCSGFSEGLAVVGKKYFEYIDNFIKGSETKFGYIDTNGNLAIEFRFDEARSFSDGLAAVKLNGKYGFIDNLGEIIIDCIYSDDLRRSKFINGLLFVPTDPWKPGKGYINKKGIEFWED